MLTERHWKRYAEVLIWGLKTSRRKRLRKNDIFLIRYHPPALRLAEVLYDRLLAMGMHPVPRLEPTPAMDRSFYTRGSRQQLVFQTPGDRRFYRHLNGSIYLHAPESITHLKDIDTRKIGSVLVARKHLRDILTRRDEAGEFSWTLCVCPTPALADQAGLDPDAYSAQVIRACFLNRTDPVAHWNEVYRNARDVKRWLNRMRVHHYHVESDKTDLEIHPGEQRRWIGISGHNIPSFEVFLSPDWRRTRGIYHADQPSFRSGNIVSGVILEFAKGEVVRASAQQGKSFLDAQLSMDDGARRVGEFSLTDRRFSRIDRFMANTLYDENYGGKQGNCHLALGSSYSDTYAGSPAELTKSKKRALGFNDSALHWDLVNTRKKRVTAHLRNGRRRTIYENGKFAL